MFVGLKIFILISQSTKHYFFFIVQTTGSPNQWLNYRLHLKGLRIYMKQACQSYLFILMLRNKFYIVLLPTNYVHFIIHMFYNFGMKYVGQNISFVLFLMRYPDDRRISITNACWFYRLTAAVYYYRCYFQLVSNQSVCGCVDYALITDDRWQW